MSWPQAVCFLAGLAALASQNWWERKRAQARAEGRDYIPFDLPVGITLLSLIVPGVLGHYLPEVGYLWWSWGAGALVVAVPTILRRIFFS
jgi:hypothetical protein